MTYDVILTSAGSSQPKAGSHIQKHQNGNSCNFMGVSHITGNCLSHLCCSSNYCNTMVYTACPTKIDGKVQVHSAIALHHPHHYVGVYAHALDYSTLAKQYSVSLR